MKKNRFKYIKLKNGINFHFYKTKKFKDNTINFYFLIESNEYNLQEYNLLCSLLNKCSKNISENMMSLKHLELYNCSVEFSKFNRSYLRGIKCIISFINNRHVDDISKEVIDLFYEKLFNPNMDNGLFNQKYFDTLKNKLINDYERSMIKNSTIASFNFNSHLDEKHPINNESKHLKKNVYNLSNERVSKLYNELLNHELFIDAVGNFNEKLITKLINENFKKGINKPLVPIPYLKSHKLVKDFDNRFNQTIIYRLYSFNFDEKDHFSAVLANMILGSGGSNILFNDIREKEGLCYYVHSSISYQFRTLLVKLECKPEDANKCIDLIDKCIDKLKNSEFSEEFFKSTKQIYGLGYGSIFDSVDGCLSRDFHQFIEGHNYDVKESLTLLNKVEYKDISKVASSIKPLYTYMLTKEN